MSVGRAVLVVLAFAFLGSAVVVVATPFHDLGVACGAPIAAAAHGKTVLPLSNGSPPVVMSQRVAKQLAQSQAQGRQGLFGISGIRLPSGPATEVVCRAPARHRVALGSVALGAAMIASGAAWQLGRRRDRGEIAGSEPLLAV